METIRRWIRNRQLRDLSQRLRRHVNNAEQGDPVATATLRGLGRSRPRADITPTNEQIAQEVSRAYDEQLDFLRNLRSQDITPLITPSDSEPELEPEVPEGKHSRRRVRFNLQQEPAPALAERELEELPPRIDVDPVQRAQFMNIGDVPELLRRIRESKPTEQTGLQELGQIEQQRIQQDLAFNIYNDYQAMENLGNILSSSPEMFERYMSFIEDPVEKKRFINARKTFNSFYFGRSDDVAKDAYRSLQFNEDLRENLGNLAVMAGILLLAYGAFRYYDIEDEKHIPNSSNFNGQGTLVSQRVGHKLDPNSRIGTTPFHIPTDLADLLASIHDFAYFQNNNFERTIADYQYYYNYAYPDAMMEQLIKYGLVKNKEHANTISKNYSDKFSPTSLGLASLLRTIGLPTELEEAFSPLQLINVVFIPALYESYNLLAPDRLQHYNKRIISPSNFALGLLPNPFVLGYRAFESVKGRYVDAVGRHKVFAENHNKAVLAWYKYLGSVGTFNDNGVFVPKAKKGRDETLKTYEEFIQDYNNMVLSSDYPEDTVKAEFNDKQIEDIVNPSRDITKVEPSGISFGTIQGWANAVDKSPYRNIATDFDPTTPTPTPEPELPPIDWKNLSGDLEVDIPVYPPRFPITPAQPAPVTVTPSPTPTTTTTTTTTTPSPTPTTTTTTTPSPTTTTITITEEDLGKFPMASLEGDIEPIAKEGEDETIVISAEDLNV